MKRNSIAVRLVVAAFLWIGGALLAGGLLLSALFRGYVERSFDARLEVLTTSLIATTDVAAQGGLVLSRELGDPRFKKPFSGWYWQITNQNGPVLRSRSLWDEALPHGEQVAGLIGRTSTQMVKGVPLRMLRRQVTLPGASGVFQFVVAGNTEEITRDIKKFDLTLTWSLTALGFGLFVAIFIQVQYGLNPMRRLRKGLAGVRAGTSTRLPGRT